MYLHTSQVAVVRYVDHRPRCPRGDMLDASCSIHRRQRLDVVPSSQKVLADRRGQARGKGSVAVHCLMKQHMTSVFPTSADAQRRHNGNLRFPADLESES